MGPYNTEVVGADNGLGGAGIQTVADRWRGSCLGSALINDLADSVHGRGVLGHTFCGVRIHVGSGNGIEQRKQARGHAADIAVALGRGHREGLGMRHSTNQAIEPPLAACVDLKLD